MFPRLRRSVRGISAGMVVGALAVSSLAFGGASVALAASTTTSTSTPGAPAASSAAGPATASTPGTSVASGSTAAAVSASGTSSSAGRSSFLLPVLPDTQFYSRYSASQFVPQYGTNPFEVQTQWVVDNKKTLNIPFAMQLGDVVDQQGKSDQWSAAAKAMKILEDGKVPYSVIPGNHDVADQGARSSEGNAANYLANFGASTLQRQGGSTLLGTFQNGYSSAYRFSAEGHDWVVLSLGWNASDDTFAWAQGILDANKGVPVILSSHAIIGIDQDQVSPTSWWYGDLLWDKLIRKNDQIVLTLNGHFHGATMRTLTNDFGHPVHEVLTDYQMAADGGNGIMTLFEFDLSGGSIDVSTISPWVGKKHADSRTSTDAPVLTGTWQQFSLAMDFGSRFGWGAPSAAQADGSDLTAAAKDIVSRGWTGSSTGEKLAAAGDASDYFAVPGTVAHWRFGDVKEGVVDENTVVPDIAGSSPMYRLPLEQTDAPDELDDVAVTHKDVPFYSADRGAVCFSDVHRNASGPDNLAFLTTEYGAPATSAHLNAQSGYTLETFLQMDADWTEAVNRWGAAISRGGARSWIGINDSSDEGAGAAWLGISNLREYQFSAADTASKNSYTLWSGEIMPGSWHHVAIVDDPAAGTVIMYVDGVPVLRNASGVGGMMAADLMPWVIGASLWNTEPEHGWYGCVGETRIVDHALPREQFLFQRADLDATASAFAVTTPLSGVLASTATVPTLEGRGVVGAQVAVRVDGADAGSTAVGADGAWRLTLKTPVAGVGAHALSFTQSIGTRVGSPLELTVTMGVDAAWTPDPEKVATDKEGTVTVTPSTFHAGDTVTVGVPAGLEGKDLYGFLFSQPTGLGAATVANRAISLTVPGSVPAGEHRLAVYTATGELVGWARVSVARPVVTVDPAAGAGGAATAGTTGASAGGQPSTPRRGDLAATGVASGVLAALSGVALMLAVLGLVLRRVRRRA